jgi:pilus assembly protein Flp/PilA
LGYPQVSIRFWRFITARVKFSHTEMAGQKGDSKDTYFGENLMLHYMRMRIQLMTRNERGASAVEYGLLVGLIAVAIIFTVMALGTELKSLFGVVDTELKKVPKTAP